MKMLARTAAVLAAACLAAPAAFAQSYEEDAASYSSTQAAFGDAELDQMLAPVALYPDELLSQVLMASTYPLEVVQAARWSRANPGLQGDDAVASVDAMDWDPSVKSLVAFPDVLQQMDSNLDWTQRLGEAFLAQQDGVMASVQRLRDAAMQAGNLASTDEMVVSREGEGIAIDSPSPDTMYVPYYDPRVVYGDWWWPAYPPVYWSPWPGYYWGGSAFAWTVGIPVGVDFFFGDFDWHRHHVRVYDHHPFYAHDHDHDRDSRDHRWRWDPHHRRDVQFRNPVARQQFSHATRPVAPRTGTAPRTTDRGDRTRAIARPGAAQPSGGPLGGPRPQTHTQTQRQAPPHQGYFPQQPAQIARPPAAPQLEQRQLHVQPQPQPLARPNGVPQQGVHLMPQFQRPAPQPAPQGAYPAPQVARPTSQVARPAPAQPIARPAGPPPAHPAPPPAQGQQGQQGQGNNEAPRGIAR